jgi:DNA-binding transcriptional ArsR family regulator
MTRQINGDCGVWSGLEAGKTFRVWTKIERCEAAPIGLANSMAALILNIIDKYDRNLDRIFQVLSDTTRRQILARLASWPVAASELARPTGLALPTVMRHLSVLEAADLIVTVKTGRRRLCRANGETLGARLIG